MNEIVENVLAKGIPAGPIYNVRQITEDKHIAIEREMFVEIEHPVIGKMKVNGNPIKLMDNMPEISKPAPTLGQHNEEIFCGLLKHSEEQIKEWRKHKKRWWRDENKKTQLEKMATALLDDGTWINLYFYQ